MDDSKFLNYTLPSEKSISSLRFFYCIKKDIAILSKIGSLTDIIGRQDVFGDIGGGCYSDHDGIDNNQYEGHSIAISSDGDTIAVGVPSSSGKKCRSPPRHHYYHDHHHCHHRCHREYVRVFRKKKGGKWIQRGQDIIGKGYVVSLSNNGRVLAIGKSNDAENQVVDGADIEYVSCNDKIRLFKFKASSNKWSEMGIVESASGSSSSSLFGKSSSLSGNGKLLAIGASGHDVSGKGSVRIYHRSFQNKTQSGKEIYL